MMIFYVTFDVLVDVLELFRTIPNYLELNSNYIFLGLFYLRTVQKGSSA